MEAPSPRSLILDLLSTLRRGSMPVGALVAAGELFGLADGTVRVALARLVSAGRVERDTRGRYRLGAQAAPIQRAVVSWRHLDRLTVDWDGGWWAVHTPRPPARGERRRHDQALRLLGFRELSPALHVRPANLAGGCDATRHHLVSIGLAGGSLVFRMDELDAGSEARARDLWDVAALQDGYRRSLASIRESAQELATLPVEQAMTRSFLVGGRMIQQLVLDPLLPHEILDPADRNALVQAMREYDIQGRRLWADFLARFDVPHLRAPADTGLHDGLHRLDAA